MAGGHTSLRKNQPWHYFFEATTLRCKLGFSLERVDGSRLTSGHEAMVQSATDRSAWERCRFALTTLHRTGYEAQ